ncbi:MAG: NHLP leader peptide family RiPP precursor [Verrucomicrobiae bacterium]
MNEQAYKSIITKCWADAEFKRRLMADPAGTLRTEGVSVPNGSKVTVVENTVNEFTFVIPPEFSELSDEALDGVSGGKVVAIPEG